MEEIKQFFNTIIENDILRRMSFIILGILIIVLISRAIRKSIAKSVQDSDQKYKARKLTNVLTYFLIFAVFVFIYRDKIGNVGIVLGLAGAGIAFALQEVITSIAGWLSIITSNSIKVGQRVKIDEIKGDVIDIGILKSTLMEVGDWVNGDLYNGRITTISNSFVFKSAIQNYSADYPFVWDEITVPIRTNSDFHLARKVFLEVTQEICGEYAENSLSKWEEMKNKFRIENAQVEPMISLVFDESWITFTIRYVVDYKKRRRTKDMLFTRLLEEIEKYDNIIMIAAVSMEVTNIKPKEKT